MNNLEGQIPEAIGNLQSLELLYLSKNKLSGSLPIGIFNISSLQGINIGDTLFSGSIPTATLFKNMPSLRILDFSTNNLTGNLPPTMFAHLPVLEGLSLSWNSFSGSIPSALFTCKRLQMLSLSVNNFEGDILSGLGNLTMLQKLYLGYNNFKALRQLWKSMKEIGIFSCGYVRNTVSDTEILAKFRIQGTFYPQPRFIIVSWRPPRRSWYNVNTDGAASGLLDGVGGIYRNRKGFPVASFALPLGHRDAFFAELSAAIYAIRRVAWFPLWLESDASFVVNLLQTRSLNVHVCVVLCE